ncbi:EscU/YscU/HrcU family type III secretion system export apparatus switch protein [Verrucomicrobia bacterium S94]|nr:EscU/YscU/HrcU family type III secretion system export apparatus switch protein [Verrucomicrobia bacterium S94]
MAFLYPEEGADGKTERATEKKRKDVRKEGKVVLSNEVVTVVVIACALAVFLITLPMLRHCLSGFILNWTQVDVTGKWSIDLVQGLFIQGTLLCALGILPVGTAAMLGSIVASVAQTKPFFQMEALKLNFKALSPSAGAKELFSKDSLIKLVLSMLKVLVISLVVWGAVRRHLGELAFLHRLSIPEALQWFMILFSRIVRRVLVLFAFVAVLDWIKEKRKFEKSIMMTRQEVREEHKNQESSPLMKQHQRRKMREWSTARMMASVPDATVVITNPTFLAIAIRYDASAGGGPVVVAKGKRLSAKRIRRLAEENGIAVIERKPLARAMYNKVEVGKPVPAAYYQAIAELLAYLYRMGDARIRKQLARR